MAVRYERGPVGGWQDGYRLGNGHIELAGTVEVGPRIVHLGLAGGRNLFCEIAGHTGRSGGDDWRLYGGHRLWHAPEDAWRTYRPDNEPLDIEPRGASLEVRQPPEAGTGIVKRLELHMSEDAPHVRVNHILRNDGPWTIELAPWALSVMAAGGEAFVPLPPRGSHPEMLAPSSGLVLWPYTDMTDPRWTWGRRFIGLRQDPSATAPQKVGAIVPDGWAAYVLEGVVFLKLFGPQRDAVYPDLGSQVELFSNSFMLELETLGPLVRLAPGAETNHVEDWFVFGAEVGADGAATFERLLPLVDRARRLLAARDSAGG